MALKQRFQQLFIGSRDLGLKFANYETSHVDESIDIMLATCYRSGKMLANLRMIGIDTFLLLLRL